MIMIFLNEQVLYLVFEFKHSFTLLPRAVCLIGKRKLLKVYSVNTFILRCAIILMLQT